MISFSLEGLPPSVNKAYVPGPYGRSKLSAEARKYKEDTLLYITQTYIRELSALHYTPNTEWVAIYVFELSLYTAKNTIKKIDVSNRIKLLEDVVVNATGIDDSATITVVSSKVHNPTATKTHVHFARHADPEIENVLRKVIARTYPHGR